MPPSKGFKVENVSFSLQKNLKIFIKFIQSNLHFFLLFQLTNFRLKEDVRKKFIQLLVINQDAKRGAPILVDTFCKMVEQIQKKERSITFAENNLCRQDK